jgi:hypothetical protein
MQSGIHCLHMCLFAKQCSPTAHVPLCKVAFTICTCASLQSSIHPLHMPLFAKSHSPIAHAHPYTNLQSGIQPLHRHLFAKWYSRLHTCTSLQIGIQLFHMKSCLLLVKPGEWKTVPKVRDKSEVHTSLILCSNPDNISCSPWHTQSNIVVRLHTLHTTQTKPNQSTNSKHVRSCYNWPSA